MKNIIFFVGVVSFFAGSLHGVSVQQLGKDLNDLSKELTSLETSLSKLSTGQNPPIIPLRPVEQLQMYKKLSEIINKLKQNPITSVKAWPNKELEIILQEINTLEQTAQAGPYEKKMPEEIVALKKQVNGELARRKKPSTQPVEKLADSQVYKRLNESINLDTAKIGQLKQWVKWYDELTEEIKENKFGKIQIDKHLQERYEQIKKAIKKQAESTPVPSPAKPKRDLSTEEKLEEFSDELLETLKERYLIKDEEGKPIKSSLGKFQYDYTKGSIEQLTQFVKDLQLYQKASENFEDFEVDQKLTEKVLALDSSLKQRIKEARLKNPKTRFEDLASQIKKEKINDPFWKKEQRKAVDPKVTENPFEKPKFIMVPDYSTDFPGIAFEISQYYSIAKTHGFEVDSDIDMIRKSLVQKFKENLTSDHYNEQEKQANLTGQIENNLKASLKSFTTSWQNYIKAYKKLLQPGEDMGSNITKLAEKLNID